MFDEFADTLDAVFALSENIMAAHVLKSSDTLFVEQKLVLNPLDILLRHLLILLVQVT